MIYCKTLLKAYFLSCISSFSAQSWRKLSEFLQSVLSLMESHCRPEIAPDNCGLMSNLLTKNWLFEFTNRAKFSNIVIIQLSWYLKLGLSWYKYWHIVTTLLGTFVEHSYPPSETLLERGNPPSKSTTPYQKFWTVPYIIPPEKSSPLFQTL